MIRPCLVLTLLLPACSAVGPTYQTPQVVTPKQWSVGAVGATSVAQQTKKAIKIAPTIADKWWQNFHDPLLNQLINEATTANLDLQQALLRIKDARILRSQTIATGLPELTGKAAPSRRFNNSTMGNAGAGIGSRVINIFQMGFDAQWELDFFGSTQRAIEAANATIETEVENSRAVLVTLIGDVVRNYIELRSNQQLLKTAQDNLLSQQETLNLTQIRSQSGLGTELEVAQAQAQIASSTALVPIYETAIKQAGYALSVLLGREPAALATRLASPQAIPQLTNSVITDLPSTLLQRRPDIRRAERQLAVANAEVGIATAELYPRINLAAFIGLQNSNITDFTPMSKSWSTASTLTMPLFNWGKLNAAIASKKIAYQQLMLAYQVTVLTAFKEVEDALVAYRQDQHRHTALLQIVQANQLTLELANERYQKGLTGFLDVLTAQQAVQQAQSNVVTSQAQLASDVVALYKALGGGWQSEAKVSDTCTGYKHEDKVGQVASLFKSDCKTNK